MRLAALGWYPQNRERLEARLERWRARVARGERLTAVFDFDNTSIFHDVGEAAMRYQLERMAFRFSNDELAAILPAEVNGVEALSSGARLADVRADLLDSYASIATRTARLRDEVPTPCAQHSDFAVRMGWLYGALEGDPALGAGVAYPFLARWMAGFTPDEVRALARDAVTMAGTERPGFVSWHSEGDGKRSGPLRVRFHTALYAQEEMRDLMRALGEAGVEVYVVSASEQHLVEGALEALDYPVPRARVFGMRLVEQQGRLGAESVDVARYPLTWRGGKREAIERFLPAPPVLVGGDSDTDYEMLTAFAETELRLVVRRDTRGAIESLYDDERTLLQGRDEPNGCFRPSRESVYLQAGEGSEGAS